MLRTRGMLGALALAACVSPPIGDAELAATLDRYFAADIAARATFSFAPELDGRLRTEAGDAKLRELVAAAWRRSERAALAFDHAQGRVVEGDLQSPFTVEQVGERPAGGWPLVVAMHGGGGVPKQVNDSQWRHMQVYYRAHPEVGGYLYCALRAPNDDWNGFYFDGFYPLLEQLVRQFVVCADVDPDRVVAIGYSHGGYGAFAVGPKLPHRFAAVHASASAPTDGETSPVGLHTLPFSCMVGGLDTAYGRRERCERFATEIAELQREHPGRYPTTFSLVEGNGHTGLPDRDLLAQLVPKVRPALPRQLWWQMTDAVVRDHYWLHVPAARKGLRLEAALDGQRLTVRWYDETALAEVMRSVIVPGDAEPAAREARIAALLAGATAVDAQAWLDARLCDLSQPLELTLAVADDLDITFVGSAEMHTAPSYTPRTRTVQPAPSLRTLCETMARRGDPSLAASWIVDLR